MVEQEKKCKRNGCQQKYLESKNEANSCKFHPGKPMFHDLKKGWLCCNTVVYDWDEFAKIKQCAEGQHSDIDPNANLTGQNQFFQSDTVKNAANANIKEDQRQIEIGSIKAHNKQKELEEKQRQYEEQFTTKEVPFLTKNGLNKCINIGCQKEFNPDENTEESCKFHPGPPIFHDLKKGFACCKKECWDFEVFQKELLPNTCAVGKHKPKIEKKKI